MSSASFIEGSISSPLVLVGEAPGRQEALKGGAFIGPAGELLTQLLAAAGISRGLCYLDNVFQFHPSNDDLSSWIKISSTGRVTETEEFLRQQAALKERLSRTCANVIIPLGNIAMYALTGMLGITKRRGSILPSTLLPGRKCIPTIHPSATLRFGQSVKFGEGQRKKAVDPYVYRYWIVNDLKRALDQSTFPEIKLISRNLIIEPRFDETIAFIQSARKRSLVSFDIEATQGLNSEVTHIALATSPAEAICIPFVTGSADYWNPEQESSIWLALAEFLEDRNVTKLAQNAVFDVGFLHRRRGIVAGPVHDTMIATAILFPDFPAGLDFLVSIYCGGEPYYKDEGKQWMKNPFGNETTFRLYNAKDAAMLMEIFPQQLSELVKQGNVATYERQKKLIYPLVYAANTGIKMDISKLNSLAAKCRQEMEDVKQEWKSVSQEPEMNLESPQQVMNYFYVTLENKPYLNSEGEITCDERALKRLVQKGIKEAEILLRYRKLTKLHGTYFEMQFDEDRRFRCSYNPVGTEQGRISSSKNIFGTGGNAQNLPSEMRELMLAD